MSDRHYVVTANPRGHRQAGASKKALEIRSETPHGHVVKKTDTPVPADTPVRAKDVRLEGLSSYTTTRPMPRFGDLYYVPTNGDVPTFLIPPELMMYIHP